MIDAERKKERERERTVGVLRQEKTEKKAKKKWKAINRSAQLSPKKRKHRTTSRKIL